MTHPINIVANKGTASAKLEPGYILASGFKEPTHIFFTDPYSLVGTRVDLNQRVVNTRQHKIVLDLAFPSLIQKYTGGGLRRTTTGSKLDAVIDLPQCAAVLTSTSTP